MKLGAGKPCFVPRLALSELIYACWLIRNVCEALDEVMLVARRDHAGAVRVLFRDVSNLRLQFVDSWDDVFVPVPGPGSRTCLADRLEARGYLVVTLPSYREACPYTAVAIPRPACAPPLARDHEAERVQLTRVTAAVGGARYAVVHDAPGMRVRAALIPDGMAVVRTDDPRFRARVFDWIAVLDHADHVHAIDSCFMMLADVVGARAMKFCHAYARDPHRHGTYSKHVVTVWG